MSNLLNVEMETRSSYMNYDNDIYNTNDVYNSNDNPKTQLNGDYSNSHIFSNELVYQNDFENSNLNNIDGGGISFYNNTNVIGDFKL